MAFAQNGTVAGIVTADDGPVAYATVRLLETSHNATADALGRYQIREVKPGTYKLFITSVGHHPETIQITVGPFEKKINAVLRPVSSQLSEVVVTGVSRATQLRSNPIPIVVMSKKEMEQNVNNNVIDAIVKGVPGVTAVTTGPNISKPFIRGLGYNRVLTLYDGVRQEGQQWGDEHGIEIDQYGIARAEIIKGPASLTYGSDALAGVINLIPTISVPDSGRITGDFVTDYHTNNGLVSNSLGFLYKRGDWKYILRGSNKLAHNYNNPVEGPVYNTAYRERILSGIIRTDKKWGYAQLSGTLYDNKQEIPDGSRDSVTRQFTRQIAEGAEDDIKKRPLVPENILKSYTLTPLHQHIQHYRLYSKNQFNLGNGILDAMVGGQQSVRQEYNHPTQPQQAGLYVVLSTLNYDLRYSPAIFKGFETSLGVNGILQGNRSKNATDFPIPDYNLFDAGAFLFVKRNFGKTNISGGVRYDTRNISWADFYVGPNPQNGFEHKVSLNSVGAKLQFPAFHHNYYGVSYSLGATYNFSERLLLKANIARGYRAPNITEIGSNGLDPGAHIVYLGNRTFKPEFNLQQDLGLIAYLKDVDIMAEVFNNQVQNYIYQSRLDDENGNPVVIVPGNSTYLYQQSKARLYGFEFTLNVHPHCLNWLAINNSVSYVTGINQNGQLIAQNGRDAKYLPLIPPLHARSQAVVKLPGSLGALTKISFRAEADVYARQSRFYAVNNTETATPGYTLINAGISATIKKSSGKPLMEVFIQADNLFDLAYQSNLNRLKYFEYYQSSPNGHLGIYNMGRNLSFKVIVPF